MMNLPWNKKEPKLKLELLKKSNVPILILDNVWHNIFPPDKKTRTILILEGKLSTLLKQQGQLNNNLKDYLKLKKKMMDGILELTTEVFTNENERAKKEMERNQRNILEINRKIEEIQVRLDKIPKEIEETNGKLLRESVKVCYKEMREHQEYLNELNSWIEETREKLKKKLEKKVFHEEKATQIYTYLHNLIGAEFIEYLDKHYWR
ncbi:MAG: hypothetical protein GX308_00920 [Epulopiscium sp.]|nr:hypothetical protein [Candidatus Epulonipiscium sp.]